MKLDPAAEDHWKIGALMAAGKLTQEDALLLAAL